jgi:hypothetical protein
MANVTTTVSVNATGWTQISLAGEQTIITPQKPGFTFLIRYSTADPGTIVKTGHKFFAKDHIPNAITGGTNTDNTWMRLLNGSPQNVEVTKL